LTGAAALEDERRRREEEHRLNPPGSSENPSQKVLSDLMFGALAASRNMSRTQDAPSAAETAAKALQPIALPQTSDDGKDHAADAAHPLDSPSAIDVEARGDRHYGAQPDAPMDDEKTATSLSYPGVLPAGGSMAAPPQRGMSLPMAGSQTPDLAPRSPSSKKHKCPYCDTEFTRHHNLKSHLLTHSQEKPYVCQTCQMRFRRLHDLKRHSKLHTGEKPHICPKCDRKFARGDALARHSKGAGGCAGRRTSMGSFGDDDYDGGSTEADDSAMTGVIYDGTAEGDMTEEERRRLSLPSIKAQHIAVTEGYASTYPPAGPSGGLVPPNMDRSTTSPSLPNSITSSGHTPNTSISSIPLSAGSSSLYSQTGITESPKPLSPGQAVVEKQRSASQAAAYAHRSSDPHVPSGLSLPPHGTSDAAQLAWLSQYPPADARKPEGPAPAAQQPAQGRSAGAVDNANNLFASGESGLWAYIQTMEEKVAQLTEEMTAMKRTETQLIEKVANLEKNETALTSELAVLRQQLVARQDQS
jgi:hypothetical protein